MVPNPIFGYLPTCSVQFFLRISYVIYLTKVIMKTFLKIIFLYFSYFMVLKSVLFDCVVLERLLSIFQEQA